MLSDLSDPLYNCQPVEIRRASRPGQAKIHNFKIACHVPRLPYHPAPAFLSLVAGLLRASSFPRQPSVLVHT